MTRLYIIASLIVIVVLAVWLIRIEGRWQHEAVERGYGEWCWPDRHFAWEGECND